jgi:hypothetical protein
MSIFYFETCHLPLRNVFPFPLSPAKLIADLFDKQRCDLPAYNAPIYLRTEYSEKSRDRTRKKSASSNLAHNLRIGAKKL